MSTPLNARDVLLQSTTPRFSTQPGQDGLTTATVFIYQRNNTGVAPVVPSVSTTYTFDPAGLTGLNNGWSFTLPDAAAGAYLFVSRALAASTTATDVLASLDWSAAQLMAKDGAAGAPGANGSSSLYPPLTDAGWSSSYGSTSTVAVSGAPSGATARRSAAGTDTRLTHSDFFPIDRTRTYRVRFWARASGAGSGETMANGVLYFCLMQHLANGGLGPGNNGREPYKPSNLQAAANQAWTEYSFTWSSPDWQVGVTQVRPDFLLNYRPDGVARVGFWEVQDFQMQDVTEVVTAQTKADQAFTNAGLANTELAIIANDNVLSKFEKSEVILKWAEVAGEQNAIKLQADALGVGRVDYNNAYDALNIYLSGLSPAYNDTTTNTSIVGTTFRATFSNYYTARQALLNAIAAKAATTANWASGLTGRPADAELLNSAIRLGGRNFCLNSTVLTEQANNTGTGVQALRNDEVVPYYRITATNGVSTYSLVSAFPKIPLNTVCVIGVDVRVTSAGDVGFYAGLGMQAVPANKWVRIFYSFTYTGARVTGLTYAGNQLDARNWKVEIGNIGTDWTPAPEDVDAIVATAQTKADQAFTNAGAANEALGLIADDNTLTKSEKPEVILKWAAIQGEVSDIISKAGAIAVSSTAYSNAYNALGTYLTNIQYGWGTVTTDSPIIGSDFRAAFLAYYNARQALLNAIAAKAAELGNTGIANAALAQDKANTAFNDAALANAALTSIASDNVLSKGEKPEVTLKWEAIHAEQNGIKLQADALGVSRVAYNNAYDALNTYLSPIAYTTYTTDSAIVGSTFRQMFGDYYAARQALLNAIAAAAATKANWANVASKPTDVEIYNNQDSIIRAPGGALLVTQSDLLTGCIKVRLPVLWSDTMMKFTVDIYEYLGGYSCSIEIAGYNYSAGSWYNVTARVIGGSNVEYPVYFGHDGTKACVFIGEAATQWTYPQIRVRDFFAGYGGMSKSNWESGWQITISSIGPQNISAQVLDTYPAADWSKIPNRDGKPANGATVGAPAGTYVAGTLAETLASQAAAGNAAATRPALAITQKVNSDFSTPYGNFFRGVGSFVAAVTGAQGTVRISWTITGGENIYVQASGVGSSTLNLQAKSAVPAAADITITCTAVDDSRTAIMTFLHSVDFYE